MYKCHPRYANSSIPYWIRDLPSGYVAPFLVAYAFMGRYKLGSSHVCILFALAILISYQRRCWRNIAHWFFFFTRTCPTLLTAKPLYNYIPNITKLSGNIEASTSMLKNSEWCQNIRTLWVARLIIFSKKIDIPPNTVNDVIQTPAGWTPFT